MNWNVSRWLAGVLALVAGCALGWVAGLRTSHPVVPALLGSGVGVLLVTLAESLHGYRLLEWLRLGTESHAPADTGMWGEIAHRVERALRLRESQTEHERERLSQFFEAIEASPNGVLLLDGNDQIDWFSSVAADHFGLQPERDLRQRITNLVRAPAFVSYLQVGNFDAPLKFVNPQGQGMLSVMIREYGARQKLVLTLDITERERAETMRRDFVANVSHELRTPLTVIGGFVETLQDDELPPDLRRQFLGMAAGNVTRMQRIVDDLLDLSRIESGGWVPAPEPVSLQDVAAEVFAPLQRSALQKQVTLRTEIAPDASALHADPTAVRQVLSNLAQNALRYTAAGEVVLFGRHEPGGLWIGIRDTGSGIAPEHHARLFERFYRVDAGRSREAGGTGLGLAIVKHLVEAHGGRVQVESDVGAGTTMSAWFPNAPAST